MLAEKLNSGAGGAPIFVEDVMSCYLYTGNGSTQTITNGIDISGKGAMIWCKNRSRASDHQLYDTNRGVNNTLFTNTTAAADPTYGGVYAWSSTGFSVNTNGNINISSDNIVSWTFRKQPKFFDVVTWTGDGSTAWRYLNHNLGSTPKCIIVKRTDTTSNWVVWHNDGSTDRIAFLNTTAAADTLNGSNGYAFGISSTQFVLDTVGGSVTATNASGGTYVAYIFAHDAGGFGLTGTDNVISCGSFTTDGSGNATVNLGYEPQFCITKDISGVDDWITLDTMRGWNQSQAMGLFPDAAYAEVSLGSGSPPYDTPTATGFNVKGRTFNRTYIYIAIRRGPMKTPTSGTSVFAVSSGSNSTNPAWTSNFPVDFFIQKGKATGTTGFAIDRLRGQNPYLQTSATTAETSGSGLQLDSNIGINGVSLSNRTDRIGWMFRRAPGFHDVVCYTGTGSATDLNHNLGVVPELMIVKRRNSTGSWFGYADALGNTKYLLLNSTAAAATSAALWNSTSPTASVFSLGADSANISGATYVAYLFASCPGVSKVGSYTGTGSTQTIDCGFPSGARFVFIKCTSNLGNWYVWDTARGMVSGTDPFLWLNSTSAENSGKDVYTATGGFQINTSDAEVNGSGSTYIFLAIA